MTDDTGRIKIVEQRWALLRYATNLCGVRRKCDSQSRNLLRVFEEEADGSVAIRPKTFRTRSDARRYAEERVDYYTPVRVRVTTEVTNE